MNLRIRMISRMDARQPMLMPMRSHLRGATLVAAAALALALAIPAGSARAAILPLDPTVSDAGNGTFIWSYSAKLSVGSQIQTGDSFTINDFAGLVSGGLTLPSGWSVAVENTSTLPPGVSLIVPDDPNIGNLRFVYTGPTTIVNSSPDASLALGIFSATSTVNDNLVHFSSSVYQNHDNSNPTGPVATGQGPVRTPTLGSPPPPVPEPSAYLLMGIGAVLLSSPFLRRQARLSAE